jgi:gliding motility-associated-like protein
MKLLNYLFFFVTFYSYSQYCPYLGPDQLLPCGVGTTTLTADLSQCGVGANPNQTTNYNVTTIPYVAQTNNGTNLTMSDDTQQGPFNIGFNFCFFGQTYTQFYVGSNGWISFSAGQSITFTSSPIPNAGATVPKNCIMGPWQDWHPGLGGQIKYQVQGVAPCRKLIVSWVNVPMYSCTNLNGTFHIVIYESTNVIENFIQNKPGCLQWQSGTATQGIHNAAGTTAIVVPGRNSTAWTAQNDAYRYTPSGPTVTPTLTWYQVGNPNPIGTGPTITVTPPQQGANYTCQFVYPICNAGWSNCNTGSGLGPDTVFVQPGPPNLPQPIINFTNPTCNSYCDGTITIIPQGGNGVQTISWNGGQSPSFNQTNLCSGPYSFTVVDAAGCDVSGNILLIDPQPIIMTPITGEDTICYLSNLETYGVPTMGNGYTYFWESSSTITSGQGSETVNTDWSQLPSGFYQDSISVYVTNQNGCFSDTSYFSPYILNILPTIDPIGPFCSYDNCVTLNGQPLGGSFTGDGVNGSQFCPNISNNNNTITYLYTQSNCLFNESINVTVNPQPIITPITPSNGYFELCEGDSVTVNYSTSSTLSGTYEWVVMSDTFEIDNLSYTWSGVGIFTINVTQTANGCQSSPQQTTITIDECPQELIFIPNTFTPDGNEYNNVWSPIFTSGYDPYRYELFVINRWGQVVWESNNPSESWDGTYDNKKCQDGTYFWVITYGIEGIDERKRIQGHLTVIR